ncbi:MAG: acylphosphatase [Eubacterium sp.]|jgi:acylphosphatase|nr:acylphosphatase [Eubacterium sp.]
MIRYGLRVHGRVQGVGFRFVASSVAHACHVTGFVRNEFDGTVTIEVQGAEHRVNSFVDQIREGNRFVKVDYIDIRDLPLVPADKETQFRVKY